MNAKPPPVRCDDESTWRHKREKIDLPRLLQLIEENGGPERLDLHGSDMYRIDARPHALRSYLETYERQHSPQRQAPWLWLGGGASLNLRRAHLEHADLQHAHLESANLEFAHLRSASLSEAHLDSAQLQRARLQHATARGAHLNHAHLSFAHLQHADLSGAHLQNCYLRHAHLEGALLAKADLRHAHLYRANLTDARLPHAQLDFASLPAALLVGARLDNACFTSAFMRQARLEGARLQFTNLEHANLEYAHLQDATLRGAHLQGAQLWGARLRGVLWYGTYLNRTGLRRHQLGPAIGDELAAKGQARHPGTFLRAREAYLGLKNNFDSIGRYDDSSWAYVKEQQMEKAMHFPTTAGHKWIRERMGGAAPPPWWPPHRLPPWLWWKVRSGFYHTRLFFGFLGLCPREVRKEIARRDEKGDERHEWVSRSRWARNWAYELLTGYGEWPHMPVVWAAVVVLLFALIYAAAGNIASGDVGALEGQSTHSPITALVHSISAFATIGFNTLEPQGWGARLLTALEAMFGIGLFALFVFTLGNRMRRS